KSGSYAIDKSLRYGWTNGEGWINKNGFTNKPGWYALTDDSSDPFEGYRTISDQGNEVNSVPTRAKTGLASMGTDSQSTDRSLGGVAWTNNRVSWGVRIRNATTNAIRGCTVIYTLEQFSSASTNRNGTKLIASTLVNASSLRSPGWRGFATNTNIVSRSSANSYGAIDGTSSGNSRRFTNTVTDLSVGPGDSLWVRWELSTTNAYPLAFAIDDLVVTNFVAASAPVITSNPASVSVVSGEPATFTVQASGAPSPSFQWMKGTNVIDGATGATLTLSPARAADAGTYSVRVANVAGTNTSASATLAVSQRPAAVLQPPSASAITYGQQLSSSVLSNGEGSVPGTFTFANPSATPSGGIGEQAVSFVPLDSANYSTGSASVLVTVNRAAQTITFGPMPSKILGDPAFAVAATASSGLPLQFSSSNESVATLSSNILTMHGAGSTLIMAAQPGDSNYLPAEPVGQVFSVSAGGPSFASEFGGASATSDSDGDGVYALLEYAFGGSTNRNDWDLLPAIDQSGPDELSIRYFARTNDPSLVFRPVGTKTLSGSWTTNGIVTTVLGTTNIGTNAVQIRRATLPLTNQPAVFLRLDVGLQP
ncbi:MAG: immunoglobulin domain-containing protein, partial [Sphaerospermopsis kisseleviana]